MSDLQLKKVFKRYDDVETLHGITLDIQHGEFVVFVGPSGCGKSTLLRLIAGLEEISDGSVIIDGQTVNNVQPSARDIAMVFQNYALYPHMTVRENMSFGLMVNKTPKDIIKARVSEVAHTLKLDTLLDRKPKQLSGGQRQRVAIGRAIVRQPKVFLFDEPLSNLDAELRVQMRIQIAKLHERIGTTVIYVTHDQVEAMTMADKIVVLRDGRILQVGTPLELYHRPNNLFVGGFIGSPKMNFIPVTVGQSKDAFATVQLPDGQRLPFPVTHKRVSHDDTMTLGIRPEHFCDAGEGDVDIQLETDFVENLGALSYVYARLGKHPIVVQRGENIDYRRGEQLTLSFEFSRCHWFDGDGHAVTSSQFVQQPPL